MKTNEKAPEGTAIPVTGASEINQANLTTDYGNCQEPVNPVIPELIAISNRLKELVDGEALHYIRFDTYTGAPEVYLQDDAFFNLFNFGEYGPHPCGVYDQVSITLQGVKFFCLVENGGRS